MNGLIIILFLYVQCLVHAMRRQFPQFDTTTPTEPPMEYTTPNFHVTDIPQSAVDAALNLDVGRYTTLDFPYENGQNVFVEPDLLLKMPCIDDYIRCTGDQVSRTMVCAYNYDADIWGYATANSYCDVYLDNCRRGYTAWRILGPGYCKYYENGRHVIIAVP